MKAESQLKRKRLNHELAGIHSGPWVLGCLIVGILLVVGCIALWNALTGNPKAEVDTLARHPASYRVRRVHRCG